MKTKLGPASPEAFELLMRGAQAFSRVSATGIRIDEDYLDRAIKDTKAEIASRESSLRSSEGWRLWQRQYGARMSLEAPAQLGKVVFGLLGHKRNPHITGNTRAAFEHLSEPFVTDYFRVKSLKKALSTYLYGIKREVVDGYVHQSIKLNTAESYRPSTTEPNFANIPVRNKEVARIVRQCVIPRGPGYGLLEADYGSQEVRINACYSLDPKLTDYVLGDGDMHVDGACDVYLLTPDEVTKDARYCAKNKFVFPQFYGSVYSQCAPHLWEAISQLDLKTKSGVPLYEHLASEGIKKLGACSYEEEPKKGTFEYVVKEAQDKLWHDRFPAHEAWKDEWWNKYLRLGGVNTLTGFRMYGVFKRNQILADPVQGSAFHCLLWSLCEVQDEFRRRKMKSRIINQVYDSLLVDYKVSELPDVLGIVEDKALVRVRQHWPWIVTPLAVEFEASETNWFDKKSLEAA